MLRCTKAAGLAWRMVVTLPPPSSGLDDEDFKPLTREQAHQWRRVHPQVSPISVLYGQGWVVLLVAALVWVISGRVLWAAEFAYGAVSVWVPTALMLWALLRGRRSSVGAQAALAGFFFWEGVKLVLALAMMAATPFWFASPTWLALMAGVMVALKAHWLVAWRLSVRMGRNNVQ